MLSFIYSLAHDYEQMFGERPNMLYINRYHFEVLRQHFSDPDNLDGIMGVLGMTVMITESAINPHLARISHTTRPRSQTVPKPDVDGRVSF
jgi:hypothetical protein